MALKVNEIINRSMNRITVDSVSQMFNNNYNNEFLCMDNIGGMHVICCT